MESCFWWSSSVKNYLFPGFNLNSIVAFVSTCFSLAVLAFTLEWFKLLQVKLQQNELILRSRQLRTVCPTESSTLINEANKASPLPIVTLKERVLLASCDLILWLFNLNISYFVMLIIMLYNGWFMVSILIGSGVGYFIFGHSFAKINLQNFRIIRQSYCVYSCPEADASRNGESTPALASTTSIEGIPCHSLSTNVQT